LKGKFTWEATGLMHRIKDNKPTLMWLIKTNKVSTTRVYSKNIKTQNMIILCATWKSFETILQQNSIQLLEQPKQTCHK